MKLTPQETRMVERLRKQENEKRRWKVALLIMDAACFVAGLLLMFRIMHLPAEAVDASDLLGILQIMTYSFPFALFYSCLTAYWCSQIIRNWHGDPKTTLLLKMVDELKEPDSEVEHR